MVWMCGGRDVNEKREDVEDGVHAGTGVVAVASRAV